MNLLRIYRYTYGDKHSFALPTLDSLHRTCNTKSFYGILIHSKDDYFKELDTHTINTYRLSTDIKKSLKDKALELVTLKGS